MAEVGENPRLKLYKTLLASKDPEVRGHFGKIKPEVFDKKLATDKDFQESLFMDLQDLGMAKDSADFYKQYTTAPQATPASQAPAPGVATPVTTEEPQKKSSGMFDITLGLGPGLINAAKGLYETGKQMLGVKSETAKNEELQKKSLSQPASGFGGGSDKSLYAYEQSAKEFSDADRQKKRLEHRLGLDKKRQGGAPTLREEMAGTFGVTPPTQLPEEFQTEYNKKKQKYEQVRAKGTGLMKTIVDDLANIATSKEAEQAYKIDNQGIKIPNQEYVSKKSREAASKYGASEGGYAENFINTSLKAALDVKLHEKEVKPLANKIFGQINSWNPKTLKELTDVANFPKPKPGKTFEETVSEDFEKGVVSAGEMSVKAKMAYKAAMQIADKEYKPKVELATKDWTSALSRYRANLATDPGIKQFVADYDAKALAPLQQAVNDGKMSVEEANKLYTSKGSLDARNAAINEYINSTEYGKGVKASYDKYLTDVSDLNNRYNARSRRQADEIQNHYESLYNGIIAEAKKKYNVPKHIVDKYAEAFQIAQSAVQKKYADKRKAADLDAGIFDNFISTTMKGLGEGIQSTAFTLGLEDVSEFGRLLADNFQTSDLNINSWSDVGLGREGRTKFAMSAGNILGRMAPGLAASAATAAVTGGAGLPLLPSMFLAAVPSAAFETADIMGSVSQQVLSQGGDIAKAKDAQAKALESQLKIWPTYLLDGLPFFPKLLKGIKPFKSGLANSVLRGGAAAGIDLVTETAQEVPQNIFEEVILAGKEPTIAELYNNLTLEKIKNTSASVASISLLMGGAPQVYTGTRDAIAKQAAKSYYAKQILNQASHPALAAQNQVQFLTQLADQKSPRFAAQMVNVLLQKGNIDKARASVLAKKLENYNQFVESMGASKNPIIKEQMLNPIVRQAAFLLYDRFMQARNSKNAESEKAALDTFNNFLVRGQGADLIMLRMPGSDYNVYTYDDFNSLMDDTDFQEAARQGDSEYNGVFEITPFAQTQEQLDNPKLKQILDRFEIIKNSEPEDTTVTDEEEDITEDEADIDEKIRQGQERTGFTFEGAIVQMPEEYRAVLDAVRSGERDVTIEEIEQTMRYMDGILRTYEKMPGLSARNLTMDQIKAASEELESALTDLNRYAANMSFDEEDQAADEASSNAAPEPPAPPSLPTQEQVVANERAGEYENLVFGVNEELPDYLKPYSGRSVRFKQNGEEFIQLTVPVSLAEYHNAAQTAEAPSAEQAAPEQEAPAEEPAAAPEPQAPEAPPAPKPKAKVKLFSREEVIASFNQKQTDLYEEYLFDGDEESANELIDAQRAILVGKEIEQVSRGEISEKVKAFYKKFGIDIETVSADDFVRILKENGASAERSQEGVFDDKNGKIYINKDAFDRGFGTTVIWHEAVHPIMNIIHNSNKPLYDKIHRGIQAAIKANPKGGLARVKAWVDYTYTNKRGYDEASRKDELIVETIGRLAAGTLSFNDLQPTLRQQFIDLINRIGKIMGLSKSDTSDIKALKDLARQITSEINKAGEGDLSKIVGLENVGKFQQPGVLSNAQMSIDGRLSEPGVIVPPKEKLPKKISPSAEEKTFQKIDELLDRYPNALTDRNQWKELMSRVFPYKGPNGEVYIPAFPEGLARMAKSPKEILKELEIVSEEQRRLASEGIEKTKEIGELFERKEMDEVDTGLYFLWNIMSIGISPYPQEAGFLRAVNNGIHEFIEKAANGTFLTGENVTITDIDEDGKEKEMVVDKAVLDYYDWVDSTLPKNTPGSGAKANLRAFGRNFLSKASEKITSGEFAGKTRLQALHEILSDRKTPTNKLRRKWQANMSAMSFNNKIFDFILLTTGRSDLFVIDRVRTEHFWDAKNLKKKRGLAETTSIYDGKELKYGESSAAGYSKMLSDVAGLVFAELANRTMQPLVKKAYEKLGVKDSPDVGRFHWETWVAASSQEVSHGSIDAIVQRKKAGEIQDAGIRQGKYGSWDFNFSYRKLAGEPFRFEFKDDSGNTYIFDDISEVQNEIDQQNNKKTYSNSNERFILKDEDGKIIKRKTKDIDKPWYEQEGVDKQKYFDFLRSKAKEVIPAPNVIEDQGVVIGMPEETGKNVKKLQQSLGGREKEGKFEPEKKDEESKLRSERAGDGGGRTESGKIAPLEGAPSVPGINGPDPQLVAVAERYAKANGIPLKRQSEYVKVDANRAKRIADAYAEMKHDPQNPKVKEAYKNLIKQTIAQYEALVEDGYKFWFIDTTNIPSNREYAESPFNALRDIRSNKQMGVFPTTDGFGSSELDVSDNPLMEKTKFKWPVGGMDGKLKPVLANDLFRAVHDAFGHGLEGAAFRARGEENAWQAHIRLFTGTAQGAITSETRGQNSWLNFNTNLLKDAVGPEKAKALQPDNWETITVGEHNRNAKTDDTIFADQKTGLMPEWTWTEGRAGDMEEPGTQASLGGRQAAPSFAELDKVLDMPPVKSRAAREALIEQYGKETVDRMIEISRNFTKIINGLEEQGVVEKDCP